MKTDLKQKLKGSRKFRVLILSLIIATGIFVFYIDLALSGTMWVLGTQDVSTENSRFEIGNNNSDPQWDQESYSKEIRNLSEMEYYVTQKNGTEPPFQNKFYDHKEEGIYVDVVSGEPLFSSKHKFDSGTGWPSFYRPLEPENIIERKDPGPFGNRVEVASKNARSHLGHIFENPNTPTGLRYCINSASLEFIPVEKLEEEGYGEYSKMFNQSSEQE